MIKFRHYKGGLYQVLHVAKIKSTQEKCVVYQGVDDATGQIWVRPYEEFCGTVSHRGKTVRRFELE